MLDRFNTYVKPNGKDNYIICIEIPDNSRNYIHSQPLILNECIHIMYDIIGLDIASDANDPYVEPDGTYYRIKMTIEPKNFCFSENIYFHSRKLNLNDAVTERIKLLQ